MKFGQLAQSMQLKKGQFGDISRNYLNVGLAPACLLYTSDAADE